MNRTKGRLRDRHSVRLSFEQLEPRAVMAGDGLAGQYFNAIDLTSLAGTRIDATVNFPNDALGANGAGMVTGDDNYSIRWTGWVEAATAGSWSFKTRSNDGVRLWVNNTQLINNWDQHVVETDTGSLTLAAGWHPVTLEYFQQGGSAHIELLFSGPGQSEVIIPQARLSSTNPNPTNLPPVVNAGADQNLSENTTSVLLDGSATDTDGTIASYLWTQLSGPNTATLSGATTDDLTASNLVPGSYVFQLAATDNLNAVGADTVTVNVNQVSGPGVITGDLKTWHKVTVTFDGPATSESATINPFLDYRADITFTHPASGTTYVVPGYYAADGDSANTSASSGNKWRVHFAPDREGVWNYSASFRTGANLAVAASPLAGASAAFFDGQTGSFTILPTDKTGVDLRGKGRLQYVGKNHLQFAGTGEYFIKQGPDSPENLLAYSDFDGPFATDGQGDTNIKNYAAHVADWQTGDPTWGTNKGKGLIGAVNYLASEGLNVFSFLTMNITGDDKNVFPYPNYSERVRLDVSRMAQWEVVLEHADQKGFYLHFKTQETENDQLLDGGALGNQRKLYYRELIARFSHHLALNWNLGEENTNTDQQRKDFAQFFYDHDPYRHNVVLHTFPGQKNAVYTPLLGAASKYTGLSMQGSSTNFGDVHQDTLTWVAASNNAGKPWVVASDESGGAQHGVQPDNDAGNSHENARKNGLWGNLMAGGAGNEWYFGYDHAHSDLTLTDFRSRDQWWDYTRYALKYFQDYDVPFWDMTSADSITSATNDYAFVKPGQVYAVYLPAGGTTNLNLTGQSGVYDVQWFNPRTGGALASGTVSTVTGGGVVAIGFPPNTTTSDWATLIRLAPIPGDYDRNGQVQQADYNFWVTHFGATTGVGLQANGNNDGVVDAADYTIWRDNFTSPTAVATSAVSSQRLAIAAPIAPSPIHRAAHEGQGLKLVATSSSQSARTTELLAARDAAFAELERESAQEERFIRRGPSRGPVVRGDQARFAAFKGVSRLG